MCGYVCVHKLERKITMINNVSNYDTMGYMVTYDKQRLDKYLLPCIRVGLKVVLKKLKLYSALTSILFFL